METNVLLVQMSKLRDSKATDAETLLLGVPTQIFLQNIQQSLRIRKEEARQWCHSKITKPSARARGNSCLNWDGLNLLLSAECLFSLCLCSSIRHTISACFVCSWALNNYTFSTISEESSSISSPLNINPVWEHMPLLYKPGWEIGTNR